VSDHIRVFLVDNHHFVREAMARIINNQPDMAVVAEAENGRIAVEKYKEVKPDVTLMDISMPEMDGIEAMTNIRQSHPAARFIVLSAYDFPEDIQGSFLAGAKAYLLKDTSRDELLRIIRAVHNGENFNRL
jgi:two-component system NarL family response regulator